jgi:hypothetical protein
MIRVVSLLTILAVLLIAPLYAANTPVYDLRINVCMQLP